VSFNLLMTLPSRCLYFFFIKRQISGVGVVVVTEKFLSHIVLVKTLNKRNGLSVTSCIHQLKLVPIIRKAK